MPIPVECSFCFENYQVLDKLAGRTIKCRACGNALDVPRRAAGSASASAGSTEPAPARKAPTGTKPPAKRPAARRDEDEFEEELEAQPERRRRAGAKSGGLPTWLLPVGIGVGVLGLLALCGGLTLSYFNQGPVPVAGGPGGQLPPNLPVPPNAGPPGVGPTGFTPPPPVPANVGQNNAGPNNGGQNNLGANFPPPQLGAPNLGGPPVGNGSGDPAVDESLKKSLEAMKQRAAKDGAGNPAGQPGGANQGNPVAGQPGGAAAGAGQPPMAGKRNGFEPPPAGGNPGGNRPGKNPGGGFEPPPQVAGGAAPADWRVKPDPLPAADAEGDSKLAPYALPPGDTRSIVFPDGSSRYAALGGGNFSEMAWEVREIRTGRKVGTVSEAKLRCEHWALSPDGKYLAGSQTSPQQVIVWEVKTGKRLGQLPQEGNFVREVLFAGPQKLLVVSLQGTVKVFELPTGRELRAVAGTDQGGGVDRERMGVSPGGKYFATAQRKSFDHCTIEVIDLETGELAGRTRLVEMRPGESSRVITDFNVKSISFAPDATELAVAFDSSQKVGVAVVDVATGRQIDGFVCDHIAWQKGLSRREVTPLLEWFPGKQRWLYQGLGLIDRVAGKMVWAMPDANVDIPHGMPQARRVFDDQTVLVAGVQGNAVALKPYEVPLDEVAKSAAVVAAGGMAVDAKLPKLTAISLANAPKLETTAGGARLDLAPDPSPSATGELLAQPLTLPTRAAPLQAARLSSARVGRLVTLYGPESRGGQAGEGESELLVMDLAKGSQQAQFALPGASDLLGVDNEGTVAATRLQASEGRVDLFSLTDGSPVFAWRPYGEEKHEHEQKVLAAVVIDKDHVLTMSHSNKLVMWDLPGQRAVYQIERAEMPGISPGRRWLTVWNGQGVRVFDALTGQVKGDLKLPADERAGASAGAFHPNGEHLAVCVNAFPAGRVVVWNLKTGQVEHDFVQPVISQTLHWCGEGHLLLDNTALVDLKNRVLVWNYELPFGKGVHVPDSPDGRHWYLTSSGGQQAAVTLVAANLPDAGTEQKLAGRKLAPEYLLQPGSKVGVRFNFTSTPPKKPNFQEEVWKGLQQSLSRAGMVYEEKSPLVFVLHLASKATGENHEFRITSFGRIGGPREVTVPGQEVEVGVEVWNGNQKIYDSKQKYGNGAYFASIKDGVSVEDYLNEQMWNSASNVLLTPRLPLYVLPETARAGLGKSELTANGVR